VQEIVKCLATGSQVDIILLDFAKAFDKVPHSRLLHKLEYYGIDQATIKWIFRMIDGFRHVIDIGQE
jgi:methylaspartate ammonia-lyase